MGEFYFNGHVIRANKMHTTYVNDLINYSVFDMFRTCRSHYN